jgi:hypothetical protein
MNPRLALATLALLLSAAAGASAAPAAWLKIANESQTVTDETTGQKITFLTTGEYTNNIFYPHCRTWSADERHVFFTSTRPRPAGTGAGGDGEAQLMAADTQTGDLYWLATIPGQGRPRSREVTNHAEYNPAKNIIIFTDIFDKNIYSLNLGTGAVSHIYKLDIPGAHTGHPPSVSADGRRVAFWAMFKGPGPDAFFKGYTNAAFYIDLDETATAAAGPARMITAYPTRIIPDATEPLRDHINITHAQLNPADRDLIAYCHGSYAYPDGSGHLSRIWTIRVDGDDDHNLIPTPKGRWHTHELWSHDGRWMYYVDTASISRTSADGKITETVNGNIKINALHCSVSADLTRLAYDNRSPRGVKDAAGNVTLGEIWWFDTTTMTPTHLATAAWNERHHTHAHPQISPAGAAVVFNAATGPGSRVALVRLPTK